MINRDVLLITGIDGAASCAAAMEEQLGMHVEVAATRKAGLAQLRRGQFGVVVVEESLAEGDTSWADQVWESAGLALPVQVNFGVSGCARLTREVKAAVARRANEEVLARRTAILELESELKGSVTGVLLQSELALREPAVSAALKPKLVHLVELAGALRERLRGTAA